MHFSVHSSLKKKIDDLRIRFKNVVKLFEEAEKKEQEIKNNLNSIDEELESTTNELQDCIKTFEALLKKD